ncbi:MAG: ribosome recycling factor [candidate division WOR-3 bacterium]|nr:ribosome recycling factor [candidate division WOR-3 bacterium]
MKERIQKETNERMEKTVDNYKSELTRIRTGKATPSLLDGIVIDYYGTKTPLNQVANISTPEPRLIVVQPWDKTVINGIEKEIQKANIGLTPNNDGNIIRLAVPPLTEERRKEIIKTLKQIAEESRIAVRNIRRDAMDELKTAKNNGDIPEDDEKRLEKKIQELTDKHIEDIDKLLDKKEKEIMES